MTGESMVMNMGNRFLLIYWMVREGERCGG